MKGKGKLADGGRGRKGKESQSGGDLRQILIPDVGDRSHCLLESTVESEWRRIAR